MSSELITCPKCFGHSRINVGADIIKDGRFYMVGEKLNYMPCDLCNKLGLVTSEVAEAFNKEFRDKFKVVVET